MKYKSVAFDEKLFEDITRAAEREERSVVGQIRFMCQYYLRHCRKKTSRIPLDSEENEGSFVQ